MCGQVVIDKLPEGIGHATQSRKVQVENQAKESEVITTGTDGDGNFCLRLKPGNYAIRVSIAT